MNTNKHKINVSDLIGRPYKAGGRGPDSFDCWGVCMAASARAGIELPDIDVPAGCDMRDRVVDEQRRSNFRRLQSARPYSIALFRIIDDNSQVKWHVGFVLENCRNFLHATGKMGVNISSLAAPVWRLFIEGFYEVA